MLSPNMLSIFRFEPWLRNHTCLSPIYKPILALKTKIAQGMQILSTDLKSAHCKTPFTYEVVTLQEFFYFKLGEIWSNGHSIQQVVISFSDKSLLNFMFEWNDSFVPKVIQYAECKYVVYFCI